MPCMFFQRRNKINNMSKRVLITGGTGFVGANLVHYLVSHGYDVHLIVRPDHQAWRIQSIADRITLHICNIQDINDTNKTMQAIRPHWIFHLATHGAYSWQRDTYEIINTNFIGTVNLVKAGLDVGFDAFVNVGSSSEYGLKDHATSENTLPEPNSDYAVTKLAATLYCDHIAKSENVNISTLRLYSVYGEYEDFNRLIPQLIIQGMKGHYPPLASPSIARDFIYIEDVIQACMAIIHTSQHGIYNIGTGIQTTLKEAVETVRELLDIEKEPNWESMPNRNWDTSVWYGDITKAKTLLGWEPKYTLVEGLTKTIQWFKERELD